MDKTSVPDSEIISIARIIEENFSSNFTIELVEESNMKYLKHRPNQLWDSLSYLTWPRYASSNVVFSSCVDSIMAQNFHNKYFIIIITKLICPETLEGNTNYEENLEVNSLDMPPEMHYIFSYGQVFWYLINLPKPVIPIALVRSTNLYENKLPYVFSNPNPEAPILPGDKLMIYGKLENMNLFGNTADPQDSQLKQKKKYDISDYIKDIIQEDELFEIDDDILLEKLRDELNDTKEDRNTLMKQNQELKRLLKEFDA